MTVYVVDLESLSSRYTVEWKDHVPQQLRKHVTDDVVVIEGGPVPPSTTPGAFLNFGGTNMYKSRQMVQISDMITNGEIKDGDYFLYTDAWNPTIIQLRYMLDLLGIGAKIGGLQHAGAYDDFDFLGRLCGDRAWTHHSEMALYHSLDHIYFASDFHIRLFIENRLNEVVFGDVSDHADVRSGKIARTGWPMEYMRDTLSESENIPKENVIAFPHRLAPEKQVEIVRDLQQQLPEYEFVICQEQQLTKPEYHSILYRAKMVFSASLQETLGISTGIEGPVVGAIPLVPDRLSYVEMFQEDFKYPSTWTEDWQCYVAHREQLVKKIRDVMENYDQYLDQLKGNTSLLETEYFSAENLYTTIKRSINDVERN